VIDFEESNFSRLNTNILKSYRPNISKIKTFKKSLDKKHIPQLVNRGYQPLYQSPVVKIALKNIRQKKNQEKFERIIKKQKEKQLLLKMIMVKKQLS